MGALTVADLVPGDAEPRIEDLVLAERLGFKRPRDIRDIIRLHRGELEFHGILRRIAAKTKPGRGRPELYYHLNEMQALLVCMWARTPKAAEVRADVARVFVAYRHGRLLPADENIRHGGGNPVPASDVTRFQRQPMLASAVLADATIVADAQRFARALPHLLEAKGRMRMPGFWADFDVRTILIATHRQMTFDDVRRLLFDNFSADRVPSRGAIGRFWLELDKVRRG